MRWLTLFTASLLAVVLPMVAVADHGRSAAKRHTTLAQRARGDVAVHKRQSFPQGQLTWYAVGLGACGNWNNPQDLIIAISHEFFNGQWPDPHCGKTVTISKGDVSIQVVVEDECMGCTKDHIDGSKAVFEAFAGLDDGLIGVSWHFNDGEPAPAPKSSSPPPPPPPSTTSHKPSSTPPPPPPSSSSSSTSSSSTHHSSSSSSSHPPSSSHSSTSSTSTHSSTSSTATPTPTGPNNIANGMQAFIGMAVLVAAGGNAA